MTITNPGTGYQKPPIVDFYDPVGGFRVFSSATISGIGTDVLGTVSSGQGDFIGIGDINLAGITNGVNGNQIGTFTNPDLASLSPLGSYGGLTPTEVPMPGSLVIGKGVGSATPTTDPITGAALKDQRGFARVANGALDIGAVEVQPVVLAPATLPAGAAGVAYAGATFIATGGSGNSVYSYAVTSGALPAGLSLNVATGALTGTPSVSGVYTFTITGDRTRSATPAALPIVLADGQLPVRHLCWSVAYSYSYAAYVAAYDAYITGTGSYTTFYYDYLATYYSMYADMYGSSGDTNTMKTLAYYAYYYGYYGEQYAYEGLRPVGRLEHVFLRRVPLCILRQHLFLLHGPWILTRHRERSAAGLGLAAD